MGGEGRVALLSPETKKGNEHIGGALSIFRFLIRSEALFPQGPAPSFSTFSVTALRSGGLWAMLSGACAALASKYYSQASAGERAKRWGGGVGLAGVGWGWVGLGGVGWGWVAWVGLGGVGWGWVGLGGVGWGQILPLADFFVFTKSCFVFNHFINISLLSLVGFKEGIYHGNDFSGLNQVDVVVSWTRKGGP